jgi:toxin CcdB
MTDQLSVHRNPGRNKRSIPFVVVVQSNRFRSAPRRVIVPLLLAEELGQPDSNVGGLIL